MALTKILDHARKAPSGQVHTSGAFVWPDPGERVMFIGGTFGEARVTVQASPDDGMTWFDHEIEDEPLDGQLLVELEFQPGVVVRLRMVGGTDTTDITAWI